MIKNFCYKNYKNLNSKLKITSIHLNHQKMKNFNNNRINNNNYNNHNYYNNHNKYNKNKNNHNNNNHFHKNLNNLFFIVISLLCKKILNLLV